MGKTMRWPINRVSRISVHSVPLVDHRVTGGVLRECCDAKAIGHGTNSLLTVPEPRCAEIQWIGQKASADAGPGFEHGNRATTSVHGLSDSQPTDACANDDYIRLRHELLTSCSFIPMGTMPVAECEICNARQVLTEEPSPESTDWVGN